MNLRLLKKSVPAADEKNQEKEREDAARPAPIHYVAAPKQPEDDSPENTSGSEYNAPLVVAERTWNWGAFFWGWLWCFFNGAAGLALLVLGLNALLAFFNIAILPSGWYVPSALLALVIFGLHCHLALRGHQLAWQRRRFPGGVEQFFAVQRTWAMSGAAWFGASSLVLTVFLAVSIRGFQAFEARRQRMAAPMAVGPPPAPTGPAPLVLPLPGRDEPRRGEPRPGRLQNNPLQNNPLQWQNETRPHYRPGYGPGDVRTPSGAPMPAFPSRAPVSPSGPQTGPSMSPNGAAPPFSSGGNPPMPNNPLPNNAMPPTSPAPGSFSGGSPPPGR